MNGTTQNELSGNLVGLDYRALLKTAQFAYRELRESIHRTMRETYIDGARGDNVGQYHLAKRIADLAADFAIVADTLSALVAGCERATKRLVNVPPTLEDKNNGNCKE